MVERHDAHIDVVVLHADIPEIARDVIEPHVRYVHAVGISAAVGRFGQVLDVVDIVQAKLSHFYGEDTTLAFRRSGTLGKVVYDKVQIDSRLARGVAECMEVVSSIAERYSVETQPVAMERKPLETTGNALAVVDGVVSW